MGPAFVALFCLGAVVAAGCCALLSIDQVDQNEYGLIFNWVTKQIGTKVYRGGTHLIGPWNKFVVFPATVQTIEFSGRPMMHDAASLQTRTKEGLALHLDISFQYRLVPDELPQLYALTNQWYESLFIRIARDLLLEAASEYEGPQYWLERQSIGDHMRTLINDQLAGAHAELWGLQLLEIDLPDAYEASITGTQVQRQLVKTRRNEQRAASIRADTEVMTSDYRRQVKIVQAGAEADYQLQTRLAEAEASKRRISTEAEVLGYIRDKLKLDPMGAVEYQQLYAYSGLENATFLANVLGATPVIHAGSTAGEQQTGSLVQRIERKEADDDREERQVEVTTPEPPPSDGHPDLIMKGKPAGVVARFIQTGSTHLASTSAQAGVAAHHAFVAAPQAPAWAGAQPFGGDARGSLALPLSPSRSHLRRPAAAARAVHTV